MSLRRFASFSRPQLRKAVASLNDHRKLLESHGATVLELKETRAFVITLPCNHVEVDSVKAVQEIVQNLQPDVVCPEICRERAADYMDERVKLLGPKAFLLKNVAAKVPRDGMFEGLEMKMAVLEGDRHKKTVKYVDRDFSVTKARMVAAVPDEVWLALWFPTIARMRAAWQILRKMDGVEDIPIPVVMQLFRSTIQLPWKWRQDIICSAHSRNGQTMIAMKTLLHAMERWNHMSQRRAKMSLKEMKYHVMTEGRAPPMPEDSAFDLGPETIPDVFQRVIVDERDLILAHNIRKEARAHGPLVFAPMGAAHIPGVHKLLRQPLESLADVEALLEKPEVSFSKALKVPLSRLMRTFQLVSSIPNLSALSGRTGHFNMSLA